MLHPWKRFLGKQQDQFLTDESLEGKNIFLNNVELNMVTVVNMIVIIYIKTISIVIIKYYKKIKFLCY